MEKITKEELKSIVKSLQLEPTEKVLENILNLWSNLEKRIKTLHDFDTTNIESLTRLNEDRVTYYLREDAVDTELVKISKKDLLNNAKEHDEDFITTSKVVE